MPEPGRRGRVGVEAGDREALRPLGCTAPRQLRRGVALGLDLRRPSAAAPSVTSSLVTVNEGTGGAGRTGRGARGGRGSWPQLAGRPRVGPREPGRTPGVRTMVGDLPPRTPARRLPDLPGRPPAAGRSVLVVGGGHVAQRRVPTLIAVGADVLLVSPVVTPAIEGLVGSGEVTWLQRASSTTTSTVPGTSWPPPTTRRSTSGSACWPSSSGCSASAPTTRRRHRLHAGGRKPRRGHRRRHGQPRRRTATRVARPPCATTWSRRLRDGTVGSRQTSSRTPGVVLVGGGPGDPELISVAGRKALMEADLVVADRLAPRELLAELPVRHRDRRRRQAAPRPLDHPGADQPDHRRRRARRAPGGAVQGRRQLRLRPRLRGGAGLPGGRRPGDRRSRASAARSPYPRSPASRSRTGASPTTSRSSPATCHPGTPSRSCSGAPSPGCAAPSC